METPKDRAAILHRLDELRIQRGIVGRGRSPGTPVSGDIPDHSLSETQATEGRMQELDREIDELERQLSEIDAEQRRRGSSRGGLTRAERGREG